MMLLHFLQLGKKSDKINKQCNKMGLNKGMGYTEIQKKWLIDNYDNFTTVKELCDIYNKKFHKNVDYSTIQGYCSKV